MSLSNSNPIDACPFIDDDDPRCASHFKLSHLAEALEICIDGYHGCPTYWRLARQQPERLIMITANGRPLQPTGS